MVDVIVSAAAATGLNKKLKEIDEVRARLRVTSDKLTTVLGASAMTADTILDEQKLQLALAKLEGRENAAELKLEMLLRANEMRAKLRDISVDKIGTRRSAAGLPGYEEPYLRRDAGLHPRRRSPPERAGRCRQDRCQRGGPDR